MIQQFHCLNLDGDGFNIEKKADGTNFDLDNDGFAEKINWTKKDGKHLNKITFLGGL